MIFDDLKKANMEAMKAHDQNARGVYSVLINKCMLKSVELKTQNASLTDGDTLVLINKTIKELDEMIKAKLKELYIPKYYVKTDEIPLTEVNKKVDFVKLEKIDIFDKDIYQMNGNLIEPKRSKTKIKTF